MDKRSNMSALKTMVGVQKTGVSSTAAAGKMAAAGGRAEAEAERNEHVVQKTLEYLRANTLVNEDGCQLRSKL